MVTTCLSFPASLPLRLCVRGPTESSTTSHKVPTESAQLTHCRGACCSHTHTHTHTRAHTHTHTHTHAHTHTHTMMHFPQVPLPKRATHPPRCACPLLIPSASPPPGPTARQGAFPSQGHSHGLLGRHPCSPPPGHQAWVRLEAASLLHAPNQPIPAAPAGLRLPSPRRFQRHAAAARAISICLGGLARRQG